MWIRYSLNETVSTLRFGSRARTVKCKPVQRKEWSTKELKEMLLNRDRDLGRLRAQYARLQKWAVERGWDEEAVADGEDERCPGRKPHARVPSGKNANAFVLDPGVW